MPVQHSPNKHPTSASPSTTASPSTLSPTASQKQIDHVMASFTTPLQQTKRKSSFSPPNEIDTKKPLTSASPPTLTLDAMMNNLTQKFDKMDANFSHINTNFDHINSKIEALDRSFDQKTAVFLDSIRELQANHAGLERRVTEATDSLEFAHSEIPKSNVNFKVRTMSKSHKREAQAQKR